MLSQYIQPNGIYSVSSLHLCCQRVPEALRRFNAAELFSSRNRCERKKESKGGLTREVTCAAADHYRTLGIPVNASKLEIKKAYRSLARKHHPDVSQTRGTEKVFLDIIQAYQVLADDQQRLNYDKFMRLNRSNRSKNSAVSSELNKRENHARRTTANRGPKRATQNFGGTIRSTAKSTSNFEESRFKFSTERPPRQKRWQKRNRKPSPQQTLWSGIRYFIDIWRKLDLGLICFTSWIGIVLWSAHGKEVTLIYSTILLIILPEVAPGYKLGGLVAFRLGGDLGMAISLFFHFFSSFFGGYFHRWIGACAVVLWISMVYKQSLDVPLVSLLLLMLKLGGVDPCVRTQCEEA